MAGPAFSSIGQLIGAALELGAFEHARPTTGERALFERAEPVERGFVAQIRDLIVSGADPLGTALVTLRTASERRHTGATFTPTALVEAMVKWVRQWAPDRIVDPGAGSGRFIVAAGRAMPNARLVAVEIEPLCALLLRAQLSVTGLHSRTLVRVADYPSAPLAGCAGRTAFVGNPPYVRHHQLTPESKLWFVTAAKQLGIKASQLAGLHAHFILATAMKAVPGDVGCFVTAAEWLDVNYGSAVRSLFLHQLGLRSFRLLEPTARPFPDADTTAVICCFEKGTRAPEVTVSRVTRLLASDSIERGRRIARETLTQTARWTALTRDPPLRGHEPRKTRRAGVAELIQLGEICRVHRGQVTGHNRVWIVSRGETELPQSVLFASVTRARELFAAGFSITDPTPFRYVVDIPGELDHLPTEARRAVERFLRRAKAEGADSNYIARHRRVWWSVGLRAPAPILASYMARRPPAFVRNIAGVRHINVAHGLYPRVPLSNQALDALTDHLRSSVSCADGRTYCGGLTKFEPREMERLLVPVPTL